MNIELVCTKTKNVVETLEEILTVAFEETEFEHHDESDDYSDFG